MSVVVVDQMSAVWLSSDMEWHWVKGGVHDMILIMYMVVNWIKFTDQK